jgi:hypothetical protein
MTERIGPLARLFRGMADLIDQDRTSPSHHEAIVKAAGVAAAYAFHAGLSRQAAVATHVRTMEEPEVAQSSDRGEPPGGPLPPGGQRHDAAGTAAQVAASATARLPPVDPRGLPGPRLGELDAAGAAGLWALLAALRRGEVNSRGQLIRLTRRLPVELASRLLTVLDGGPALVRAEAVRVLDAIDPQDPATPAVAVIVLGWLEAAEQVLVGGGSAQELRVLLRVGDQGGEVE